MAYLSLYRKYRPQTFADILGQEHVSTTLANAIADGRVAHAYLFTGPRGTGKTSTARILAKALNCERGPTPSPCGTCASCSAIAAGSSMDVIEMDAASHSKVDETREILAGVPLATAGGRKKVYVIDEVHMLSTGSFNALLKTLEEPPEHVVFVLATTEAHKVLATIVSRTQRFDFRRIPAAVIESHLAEVAKLEGIDVEPDALALIARHADGSARDALSTLDQLSSIGGHVGVEDAESMLGARRETDVFAVFDAVAEGDLGRLFELVHSLAAKGADLRQVAIAALSHARALLLLKAAPDSSHLLDLAPEEVARLQSQAESFTGAAVLRILDLVGNAWAEMRNAPNHRLLLEVALVRSAAPETDPSPAGLLERIERLERRIGHGGTPAPARSEAPPAAQGPQPRATQTQPAERGPQHAERRAPAPQRESRPGAERSEPPMPKATMPSAAVADTSAPADDIGLGHVKDAWGAALSEVARRSKRVGAFLNPSAPVGLEDGTLVVEVQSEFHAQAMSEERNHALLQEALQSAVGARPKLTFVERGAAQPSGSEAEDAKDDYDEPAAEVEDPIEMLKKGLGAEVVEEIGEA